MKEDRRKVEWVERSSGINGDERRRQWVDEESAAVGDGRATCRAYSGRAGAGAAADGFLPSLGGRGHGTAVFTRWGLLCGRRRTAAVRGLGG